MKKQLLLSLDLETKCARNCDAKCDCALFPNSSVISIIGLWCPDFSATFRDLASFSKFVSENPSIVFTGHNLKFDIKHLHYHGVSLDPSRWIHDTQLMASTCLKKIPDNWLEDYEELRLLENKKLPHGYSHRSAKGQSLKTLAPYFLGVDPFWEDPTNHDNEDYVLKDCEYTYRLFVFFEEQMKKEGTWRFYEEKLMKWAKTLLKAEERGVYIDQVRLGRKEAVARKRMERAKKKLDALWSNAYRAYAELKRSELMSDYDAKEEKALAKAKDITKARARYKKLRDAALERADFSLDLNSPKQVLWLLKDFLKLDTQVRVRDKETNVITDEDSTGVEVLQRLAKEREDIATFLDYREQAKLCQAFFPSYREFLYKDGAIHTSFNLTGTRTGRLSASSPNAQNIPSDLHSLFVARPGYRMLCYDESAIEARLIAYFSEDSTLCDLVINGKDIHGFHATLFFGLDCDPSQVKKLYPKERQLAKNVGFGLFYGAGPNRIKQEAQKMGWQWDDNHCLGLFKRFKKAYKGVFDFKQQIDLDAEDNPQIGLCGRIFSFPNVEDIHMKNFNTLIQGSASDLVLESAHKTQEIFDRAGIDGHLLLLVHDEVVFEVKEDQLEDARELLIEMMTEKKLETSHGIIPLAVEGGPNKRWAK